MGLPRHYTITADDVGREVLGNFWRVSDIMGRVQAIDVGKRVYRVPDGQGGHVLQVENDDQRNARLARET